MNSFATHESTNTASPPLPDQKPSRFERLATWSYHHRGWSLALWVMVLAAAIVIGVGVGGSYHNDHSLPDTESQRAVELLEKQAPTQAGDSVQIVLHHADGLSEAETQSRVSQLLDKVRPLPHVAAVTSPYAGSQALSRDGTIGYATVTLDGKATEVPKDAVREIIDTAQAAEGDGLRVELGGDAVRNAQESEGGASEGVGIMAALVILVILFGSLLAASLPIITAVFAVGTTIGLIALVSHFANVADYTIPLMGLVGLGVGIDYALLVFSRFRGELIKGATRERAVRTAIDTAGRSVFFAAFTVVIALLGLAVLGLASLQGVALALSLTVLLTMVSSLTLLPALLHVFGGRIERKVAKSLARRQRRGRRPEGTLWRKGSAAIRRRPVAALLVAGIALLAMAAPAFGMRLGFADEGNDPASSTTRQAYDLMAKGFGPGFSGPLVVVSQGDEQAANQLRQALDETPGVASTTPPSGDGDVRTVIAFPESKPQDKATSDLVHRLRDDVLPPLSRDTGATFLVGGPTAASADFSDAVADRFGIFIAIVVGVSALLLMAVFRSVLIPIKAAVLNLLSIGAALGVMTLVFQHGWFGVDPGPIEAFVPVMIFAIVFGLSMDYEVFLVSRMHEEWKRTGDAKRAIDEGLGTTGRVITAAGAVMIVVFGAFLLNPSRMLQQMGLGLATAILLDAFVIRCLVLPAIMGLLGKRAWWLPRWLGRVVPNIALEKDIALEKGTALERDTAPERQIALEPKG